MPSFTQHSALSTQHSPVGTQHSPVAIRTENLTKTFGATRAVDGLTLSIPEGEIFGLVGPDGAGKTTTMRLLAGILDATSGDAWVAGHHVGRETAAVQGQIGYMSQRFGLYPDLTVEENMRFYADLYGVPARERPVWMERLLGFSNLTPFRRRRAGNLSGGMKQKLGLACALIHTPKVLILDEPTNGVDPVSRRDFWNILYQLQRDGVTVFVSTAYLDEAERCARVGLLHKGQLLACDTPDGVKGLLNGTVLEVRAASARAAAEVLRKGLPGLAVSLFGDRVHVVSQDPAGTREAVLGALSANGMEVESLHPVTPSLEDVFVALLSEKGTPG